jgi:hypothetical protein
MDSGLDLLDEAADPLLRQGGAPFSTGGNHLCTQLRLVLGEGLAVAFEAAFHRGQGRSRLVQLPAEGGLYHVGRPCAAVGPGGEPLCPRASQYSAEVTAEEVDDPHVQRVTEAEQCWQRGSDEAGAALGHLAPAESEPWGERDEATVRHLLDDSLEPPGSGADLDGGMIWRCDPQE